MRDVISWCWLVAMALAVLFWFNPNYRYVATRNIELISIVALGCAGFAAMLLHKRRAVIAAAAIGAVILGTALGTVASYYQKPYPGGVGGEDVMAAALIVGLPIILTVALIAFDTGASKRKLRAFQAGSLALLTGALTTFGAIRFLSI